MNRPLKPKEPRKPTARVKPQKVRTVFEQRTILPDIRYGSFTVDSFSEKIKATLQKEGLKPDTSFEIVIEVGYDSEAVLCVNARVPEEIPNELYNEQLARFKLDEARHKKDVARYETELVEYKKKLAEYYSDLKIWTAQKEHEEFKRLEETVATLNTLDGNANFVAFAQMWFDNIRSETLWVVALDERSLDAYHPGDECEDDNLRPTGSPYQIEVSEQTFASLKESGRKVKVFTTLPK